MHNDRDTAATIDYKFRAREPPYVQRISTSVLGDTRCSLDRDRCDLPRVSVAETLCTQILPRSRGQVPRETICKCSTVRRDIDLELFVENARNPMYFAETYHVKAFFGPLRGLGAGGTVDGTNEGQTGQRGSASEYRG